MLARFQSIGYDPHTSDRVAELHWPNCNLVGTVNHGDLKRTLQFYNSSLRNEQCARVGSDGRADLAILPGTQPVSGIREKPRQLNRAGVRIHLAICEEKPALMR